ncbi:Zinc transporter ZupT [Terrisporobacter glycolicus ATCC 14880 = DSM 1288]|uniref:Zinc transporter ZupT n=2 Tax=Terrisporobacter glycolicus TaxID=36841 RepID=A0ABZ2ESN2_9FIRM
MKNLSIVSMISRKLFYFYKVLYVLKLYEEWGYRIMNTMIGILIPLVGTTLGAACVFIMKKEINALVNKGLLGFASGVMIAASVWSLIIPAINMSSNMGKLAFAPAAIGILVGIGFMLILDTIIPHLHYNNNKPEGLKSEKIRKTTMLVLAVALHNIPEGMAVGVVFAGVISQESTITMAGALILSIGIAIQNFPEGAIISMPLRSEGMSKSKSFLYGFLSGVVEPIGAVLTILFSTTIQPLMPYLLSFAAGAMIYVVVEELIPEASVGEHSNIGTIGFGLGFVIMMILDVALG